MARLLRPTDGRQRPSEKTDRGQMGSVGMGLKDGCEQHTLLYPNLHFMCHVTILSLYPPDDRLSSSKYSSFSVTFTNSCEWRQRSSVVFRIKRKLPGFRLLPTARVLLFVNTALIGSGWLDSNHFTATHRGWFPRSNYRLLVFL